jgi:DNA-binding NtrC family response regulator
MPVQWEAVILSTDWEWRHPLGRTLDSYGVDYAHASSVQECREIVARESVGMIFWDSHLADGTYQELAESVGSVDRRVRIVVVSHMDDWDWRLGGARKGAFAVIPFPCHPTDIEWALSRANRDEFLEGRSAQVREFPAHA